MPTVGAAAANRREWQRVTGAPSNCDESHCVGQDKPLATVTAAQRAH
jgi:hypothetical protein